MVINREILGGSKFGNAFSAPKLGAGRMAKGLMAGRSLPPVPYKLGLQLLLVSLELLSFGLHQAFMRLAPSSPSGVYKEFHCLPCLVRLQSTGLASNILELLVLYGFLKFVWSVLYVLWILLVLLAWFHLLGEPKSRSFAQAAPSCPRFPAFSGPTAAPRSCPVDSRVDLSSPQPRKLIQWIDVGEKLHKSMVNLESVPGKTIHITCHIYICICICMYICVNIYI